MLSFDTRRPAPRSSRPFFLSAGDILWGSVQPLKLDIQTSIAICKSHHTSDAANIKNRMGDLQPTAWGPPVGVPLT
jgi:hypothetical protein